MRRWALILLMVLATLLLLAAVSASLSEDGQESGPLWRAVSQVMRFLGLIAQML